MLLSIVIPVFNEARSLDTLLEEIKAATSEVGRAIEVLFVDDGSTDESWGVIEHLAAADSRVRGIQLRRNFGKSEALHAGFQEARGEIVFTLDADLQDDPREIPKFLAHLERGFDVVSGWKRVRRDRWGKRFASRVFNALVNGLTHVRLHDHNCGFKCYRAAVLREIHVYGDMHRFIPVLAAGKGFRIGEVEVHHRPRRFGVSKFGWSRIP
ncbi:MAG TPA: glycosyltransferase family 2 protein, partial [Pirellulaceae bacterium]